MTSRCPNCGFVLDRGHHKLGLTPVQNNAMRFISAYLMEHGVPPTYEDLRIHLGLASKSGVNRIVRQLVERGRVKHIPGRARTLTVTT